MPVRPVIGKVDRVMTSTTERVQQLIDSGRSVDMSLQEMGDEVGVTREMVRLIFVKLGVKRINMHTHHKRPTNHCPFCGIEIGYYSTCCRPHLGAGNRRLPGVEYPCANCGKLALFPDGFY